MMKFWEKLESKSSSHYPNSWWVRGRLVLNTCHLKKLGRAHEDQIKPRTSELFNSETLEQFNNQHPNSINLYLAQCRGSDIYIISTLSQFCADTRLLCYSAHSDLGWALNVMLAPFTCSVRFAANRYISYFMFAAWSKLSTHLQHLEITTLQ